MKNTNENAAADIQRAIDDSVGNGVIVTLDWSQEREVELLSQCDDWADNGVTLEFWSDSDETGDDARNWRVHLKRDEGDECRLDLDPAVVSYHTI